MSNKEKVDDSLCPLCRQSNRCNVQATTGCWCRAAKVPTELLARVPKNLQGKSCICNNCIASYHQQQTLDVSK